MTKLAGETQNGVLKKHNCPVCQTANESNTTNCVTCAWYFPLAGTPQYEIELSRAKQQYQMVSSFNQMFQHIQVQSKMLEKISFRLDDLENKVTAIKENKQTEHTINQKYNYPELAPIQKVADFNTVAKRKAWWEGLEAQWQKAFKQIVLRQQATHQPTDEEMKYVLESPILRIVGPKAMHANIDFELTNLSGLRHLTDLTLLTLSQHAFTHLAGIEHLAQLKTLFVDGNQLTNIKAIHYLPQLQKLYCQSNQLEDLHPLEGLTNLEVIHCGNNCLTSLEGITLAHVAKLEQLVYLPNKAIPKIELERMTAIGVA